MVGTLGQQGRSRKSQHVTFLIVTQTRGVHSQICAHSRPPPHAAHRQPETALTLLASSSATVALVLRGAATSGLSERTDEAEQIAWLTPNQISERVEPA